MAVGGLPSLRTREIMAKSCGLSESDARRKSGAAKPAVVS